ncbi:MAG TPA: hypothetical protein VGE74_19895 [Gemmata sp.]
MNDEKDAKNGKPATGADKAQQNGTAKTGDEATEGEFIGPWWDSMQRAARHARLLAGRDETP